MHLIRGRVGASRAGKTYGDSVADAKRKQFLEIRSPWNSGDPVLRLEFSLSEIDEAVAVAQKAQTGLSARIPLTPESIQHLKLAIVNASESLGHWSAVEGGRTPLDFESEFRATLNYLEALKAQIHRLSALDSRGVSAVIGSSVWPMFYGIQFVLANFVRGNPVIFKPSERASAYCMEWVSSLIRALNIQDELQVLVGDRETGRRLACHEKVRGVIFQGSYEVGMRLRQDTSSQPGKEVLLYLGAKNPMIAHHSLSETQLEEAILDAYLGSGQNCRSAPLIFVRKEIYAETKERLVNRIGKLKPARSQGDRVLLGPLLDASRLERYLKHVALLEKEGAQILVRGNRVGDAAGALLVTPTLAEFQSLSAEGIRKLSCFHTEVMGPSLTLVNYEDLQDLSEKVNELSFGLCAGFKGELGPDEKRFLEGLEVGSIRVNGSLYSFDPWLSSTARKKSGNHGRLGMELFDQVAIRRILE